ncbi:hypothetical protein chiPu_0028632, partial [Chiloscyllium punctatum]|nr:hypothetical protein [Chiloscyllium punctatum]
MTLRCEGDPVDPDGLRYFFRNGQPVGSGEGTKWPSIRVPGEDRTGFYQCRYALQTPQRWFLSPLSERVRVTEI